MDVISVENVSKMYKLYDKTSDRLKEAFSLTHKQYYTPFYALHDISFSVKKGETVGIIGTNGSGKSTILKIITGVTKPTEGKVHIEGKVSALLELGAGFDMDYTGVENIYMNGSVMGFSRKEMDQKKDEILEFADIGDFAYQPVKTYSSGMLVRLAFALAISVEPEVMIIDEALAVGDAFFQAKCFHKLEEIKAKGTTILFVSHDILSVKKLCSRAVWIEKGVLREQGDANEICEKYMGAQIESNNEENMKLVAKMSEDFLEKGDVQRVRDEKVFSKLPELSSGVMSGTGKAEIKSFYIKDENGKETIVLKPFHKYKIGVIVEGKETIENAIAGVEIENTKGVRIIGINSFMKSNKTYTIEPNSVYEFVFEIELPGLCKGEYLVTPAISSGVQNCHVVHNRLHDFMTILVDNEGYNLSLLDVDFVVKAEVYDNHLVKFE